MNTTRALTLFFTLALLGFALLALSTPTARAADAVIVRVTTTGTTDWPCGQTDWSNTCALQTALTHSVAPAELWVAAGTYKPTTGADRTATFHLVNGVALYGGFAGTEISRGQRNLTRVTTLSGDIGTLDDASDNAYHVVTSSGVTTTAVLDGFTVTGGNSSEYSDTYNRGGGMYNNGGSPTLTNITFVSNTAENRGGGMYNNGGSPMLTNVTFSGNTANAGGGTYNESNSTPTLINVTFTNNAAYYDGGGMYNDTSNPTLSNVTFSGNSAGYYDGGGIYNDTSNPTLSNVTFVSNTAQRGGGMFNADSSPVLANVTFSGNSADSLNGYGGGMFNRTGNPVLTNVTFSGNSAWIGGGMHGFDSSLTLNNVAFISNTATGACGGLASGGRSLTLTNATLSGNSAPYGGGMCTEGNSMAFTNVTFSSNTATYTGGGIDNYAGRPTLTNVTFSGNSAGLHGGGMYNRTSSEGTSSNPTIRNAIFWGNTAPSDSQIGNDATSTASLSDSVVQGGCPDSSTVCTHILTADPHLGALGNWGGRTQTIPLLFGSSAIDAGDDTHCPAFDQRGIPRPQGAHCDIGTFESIWTYLPLIRR